MKQKSTWLALVLASILALVSVAQISAQGPSPRNPRALTGTAFTYQGQLKSGGNVHNGTCDFQFGVWDDASVGAQKGVTQTVTSVNVTAGLFMTTLNGGNEFGASAFDENARWRRSSYTCR
jgi:hypothetical protein